MKESGGKLTQLIPRGKGADQIQVVSIMGKTQR